MSLMMCCKQYNERMKVGFERRASRTSVMLGCTVVACLVGVTAIGTSSARANDWASWRGPEQTGMSREKAVVTHWSQDGENLLWKVPVGGRNTPLVMGDRVFATAPVGSGACVQERIVSLNADTGAVVWEQRFNVFNTDIVENRVAWTSPVGDPETGYVYVHGTGGEFFCFDRDGHLVWKTSLEEEWGRYSGYGGRLHTPIIDEDRVIISEIYILAQWGTGRKKAGHRYFAFDKRTGTLLWTAQPGGRPLDTTYATPVVTVINGVRMLIAPNADGNVYGMVARTGERVWSFKLSKRGLNTSPVVDGHYVYVSHSEENLDTTEMGRVLCIDASQRGDITKSGEVWRVDGLGVGYSSPAIANGRLYVATNNGQLHCLNAKSGKTLWTHDLGTVMKGSPTVTADGVIYIGEVNGRFHILKDEGDRCVSLDVKNFTHPGGDIVEIYGSPAISNGRVYFMTRKNMYCLGQRGTPPVRAPVPHLPPEHTVADASASSALRLMLIPAETNIKPGESVSYRARLFDDRGVFVSEINLGALHENNMPGGPVFTVSGLKGTLNGGVFSASKDRVFSAGTITLKMLGVEDTARLRIAPQVNVRETFDTYKNGSVPPGWIGVDAKTEITEKDGSMVFHKKAERPSAPYSRMHAYSYPPIPARYTVQADLMREGSKGRRLKLPDMGLINSRYKLIMLGREQRLRIVSWSPLPRLQKDVPYEWKQKQWYRAKLRVDIKDGRALVRGKVWPREEKEPTAWMIQVMDPCPNVEGSPGLYAYSKGTTVKRHGASVYYDNYVVTPND